MRARATSRSSTSMSGRVRKPVGACPSGACSNARNVLPRSGLSWIQSGAVSTTPTPSTACQNSANLGRSAASTTTARNQPDRLSHLHPPPWFRPSGHHHDRTVGSSVSGPCRPTTTPPRPSPSCSPRRRDHRTTLTSSRRTPSSANRASTRRARRWSPPPDPRSPTTSPSPRSTRSACRRHRAPRRHRSSSRACARTRARVAGLVALSVTVAAPLLDAFVAGGTPVETIGLGATASPGRIVGPRRRRHARRSASSTSATSAEVPTLLAGRSPTTCSGAGPAPGSTRRWCSHALVALVHLQLLARTPALARTGTELARRQNSLAITLLNSRQPRERRPLRRRPTEPARSRVARRACRRPTSGASRS